MDPEKNKKPPETYIELTWARTPVRIALPKLLELLAPVLPDGLGTPDEIELGIERSGQCLRAHLSPGEAEYPGIAVDGRAVAAGTLWLGGFELPCADYPNRIAARLYAGNSGYETDSPIVLVTHDISEKLSKARTEGYANLPPMSKLVYVDRDLAAERPWNATGEDKLPEHKEDE